MSDEQSTHVRQFVEAGGRLCVTGPLATHDEWMFPREKPLLTDLPDERVTRVEADGSMAQAVDRALDGKPSMAIRTRENPPGGEGSGDTLLGICAELTERGDQRFVHLVNYRDADPVKDIAVRLRIPDRRQVKEVLLASPGRGHDLKAAFARGEDYVQFVVPRLDIYEVAVVSMQ
jgi:hypothetical protein